MTSEPALPEPSASSLQWRGACRPSDSRGLVAVVRRQFGCPSGPLGHLVGSIMAAKSDSRRRAAWTLDLLEIEATDSVLEIGFGPGLALDEACRRASRGRVVGVDHSAVMVRQARRRLRRHLVSGRVELHEAAAETIGSLSSLGPFDRIFAVNSLQFWSAPGATLSALVHRLRPAGRIALTFQPPWRGASESDARRAGEEMTGLLRQSGLTTRPVRLLELERAPAACSIGVKEIA